MKTQIKEQKKWITLDPGEFFVTDDDDVVITTLLGSCVSACLYDPVHKISGMNHFLLSSRRYSKDLPLCTTEAGRYGVHAMELVINKMLNLGAQRKYLKAKAFGGGNVLNSYNGESNFYCVGDVNVRFIQEFLTNENISLVSSALGGELGRVIRFQTNNQAVFVKKIAKTNTIKLEKRDKKFWERKLAEQEALEKEETNIDLW
jgi:chemotaxis protein CheD